MFDKILIANRGEIAVRIIRTCRDMGIISVAVYSEADRDSLHVQIADESICIGGAHSKDSYLSIERIISAAIATGAGAIHPGFGFLAENPEFAQMCNKYNIAFIGPDADTMKKMGDKIQARQIAHKANVPITPGSVGEAKDYNEALAVAKKTGYPLLVKAAAGGGGRGIRLVKDESELKQMYNAAKAEALACFGDDRLYIEKCIANPRHVEIQVLADNFGNVVHLFDRDCTIQRRHQKLLEEAPSSFINDSVRNKMGECAIKIAKLCDYKNAGTVEFLVDADRNFYFCEMNTRIQVEHPVTEEIIGIDLIKEQINIACGQKLSIKQKDIKINGWAMECRIYAEDPANNFAPCGGTIEQMHQPGGIGIRVDSGVYQGYTIPPFYDNMIAKLIVTADTRENCIMRMKRTISEYLFYGITTNIDFHIQVLNDANFINGNYGTDYCNDIC
ncbi:MAG: acetyl-CoA carboxylase biotin carboxylase subunit [Clostridiaceae bacterium]|nr:acetyl-CoA carboxylase biotin carboxylase subunit [Clostridiaceae bacterium]